MKNNKKVALLAILTLFLSACGGDGDTTEPAPTPEPVNTAPFVTLSDITVQEKSPATITAEVTDSDGSIASYSWVKKSGPDVVTQGNVTGTLSFTAPEVSEDQIIVFTLTVTDDKGASTSADVNVTVKANILALTLQGKVTDATVMDAKVSVEIAHQSIDVVTDTNGNYSADINIDDSFADELVKVTAVGLEADSKMKLVSLLGDFESLQELAGDDSLLSSEEIVGVNVTNVSTAIYALMKQANGGEDICSKDKYIEISKQYDGRLILPIATAIKLVLSYSSEYPEIGLPGGVADVLELANDQNQVSIYLEMVQKDYPDIYMDAESAVIGNPDSIILNPDASSISGRYFFPHREDEASQDRIIFSSDGTGKFFSPEASSLFTWTVEEGNTIISFPSGGALISTSLEYNAEARDLVNVEMYRLSSTIKWIDVEDYAAKFLIKHELLKRYPDTDLPFVVSTTNYESVSTIKGDGLQPVVDLLESGGSYSIPVPGRVFAIENPYEGSFEESIQRSIKLQVGENSSATLLSKQYSGDGSFQPISIPATYSLEDNGSLKIKSNESAEIDLDLVAISSDPIVVSTLQSDSSSGGGYLLEQEEVEWDEDNLPGIYDLGWNFFEPLQRFWVEIYDDGRALTVSTLDRNRDGILSVDEFTLMPGLWRQGASGEVAIRRYRNTNGFCESPQWEATLEDECRLYNERVWDLYSVIGQQYYVFQSHEFYLDWIDRDSFPVDYTGDHALWLVNDANRRWAKLASRPAALPSELLGQNGITLFETNVLPDSANGRGANDSIDIDSFSIDKVDLR
ncbi:cadherin-like domain-containing protein [Shewanella submarina]|uniref:Cadherin-like domain-containing protein n=1 Tax=Shewanella submarina TaxID=2016376 RepID=A0ABV7GCK0_9GAMM|nr:cadherin-like domain-containing protein [Shewanella submarina]MCL1039869.1 cadherin-like domain-containing protein [Shewanella submarina]